MADHGFTLRDPFAPLRARAHTTQGNLVKVRVCPRARAVPVRSARCAVRVQCVCGVCV